MASWNTEVSQRSLEFCNYQNQLPLSTNISHALGTVSLFGGRFASGLDTPPGDYALQPTVTDKNKSNRQTGSASQALDFTILEK